MAERISDEELQELGDGLSFDSEKIAMACELIEARKFQSSYRLTLQAVVERAERAETVIQHVINIAFRFPTGDAIETGRQRIIDMGAIRTALREAGYGPKDGE